MRERLLQEAQSKVEGLQQLINSAKPPAQQLRSCQDRLLAQREQLAATERSITDAQEALSALETRRSSDSDALAILEKEHSELLARFGTAVEAAQPSLEDSLLQLQEPGRVLPEDIRASLAAVSHWLATQQEADPAVASPGATAFEGAAAPGAKRQRSVEPRPSAEAPAAHGAVSATVLSPAPAPDPQTALRVSAEHAQSLGLEQQAGALRALLPAAPEDAPMPAAASP